MPDLISIVQKRWQQIAAITIGAVLLAAVLLLLLPKQYESKATALPANSVATDKGSVFNRSIQELYSSLGSPDELDRFLGTARLDTIYIAVAKAENLPAHYGVKSDDHALYNAAQKLKKNTKIERTEFGELQVKVWDEDRFKAAVLANGIMQQLQQLHQHLQSRGNALVLQKLIEHDGAFSVNDSTNESAANLHLDNREGSKQQYQDLLAEYQLMVNTNPPALLIVEGARPALTPDKPYVLPTLLLTFFAALVFSFLVAALTESIKSKNV